MAASRVNFTEREMRSQDRIEKLERSIYGDGNGEKGLIRRVDGMEIFLKSIRKQNWAIIGLLTALLIELLTKIMG